MSHFWTIWDPVRSRGGFFKASIHCYILGPAHVFSLNLLPNVLFLGRCYTPTKHIFKKKHAQNFGVSFFSNQPHFFLTKRGSQTNLLNLPSTLGRQPFSSKKPKWQLLHSLLPLPQRRKKIGKISGKTFWWLATVLGKGLGVLSSWRCQHEQPQWVKKQMGFSGRDFPHPLLYRVNQTPYFLWFLCSWAGPVFAIVSINHQRVTQHMKTNLSNAINTGVCDLIFQGTLLFSGR